MAKTKSADERGRIYLGSDFRGQEVQIHEIEGRDALLVEKADK